MAPFVVLSAVAALGVVAERSMIPPDRVTPSPFVEAQLITGPETRACETADPALRRDSETGGTAIRLRLQNNANVESGTLAAAMKRVDFVYSQIGIRSLWTMFEPAMDDGIPLFDVVIANSKGTVRRPSLTIDEVIGEAVRDGHRVYAHYDRITEAASLYKIFRGHLLADVIAHEIGHLLLGGRPHSKSGIMRVDILTRGVPRTFDEVEADLMRQRILEGRSGRPVVQSRSCDQPS